MSEGEAPPPEEPDCNCEAGAPKWVVTFGDMMSLLLCFFVLLLSFSTTDIVKYREMQGSMKEAFGVAQTDPEFSIPAGDIIIAPYITLPKTFAALVTVRAKAMNLAKSSSKLEMESGADWVRLKVDGDALFASGGFEIKPEAAAVLEDIGELINDFDGVVFVEGHTDGDPPTTTRFEAGSYLGNYELGALRSIAVLGYFVGTRSVDKNKLIPVTFGETKPRETNEYEEGKRQNRRVEFEFRSTSKADISELDGEVISPK